MLKQLQIVAVFDSALLICCLLIYSCLSIECFITESCTFLLRTGYQGLTGNVTSAKWAAVSISADASLLFCFDRDV